jgi:hypothetical protein
VPGLFAASVGGLFLGVTGLFPNLVSGFEILTGLFCIGFDLPGNDSQFPPLRGQILKKQRERRVIRASRELVALFRIHEKLGFLAGPGRHWDRTEYCFLQLYFHHRLRQSPGVGG